MNKIYENDRIDIDFDEIEENYRITLFDKNYHYEDEIIIDKEAFMQMEDYFNNNKTI